MHSFRSCTQQENECANAAFAQLNPLLVRFA